MLCHAREAAKYEIVMVKVFLLLCGKTIEKQRSGMLSGYESSATDQFAAPFSTSDAEISYSSLKVRMTQNTVLC